jgi:hypothetical protein
MSKTLLEGGWSRVAIGFGIAAVAGQVAVSIGEPTTLSSLTGLLGALVVWSWGMVLTIHPISDQVVQLRETLAATGGESAGSDSFSDVDE